MQQQSLAAHIAEDEPVLVAVVVVVIVVVVMMIVVVPATVSIAAVLVPLVIVINMAVISVPVSCIKLLTIVVRSDPSSPLIRRSCPITVMPLIVISYWIPITVDIRVTRTRAPRHNVNHTGAWWRTNSNAERDLGVRYLCASQQKDDK
jgi:hypothetical protein